MKYNYTHGITQVASAFKFTLMGRVHPKFVMKLIFEIAVDRQTRTLDQNFEGVPNPNHPLVHTVQPRP